MQATIFFVSPRRVCRKVLSPPKNVIITCLISKACDLSHNVHSWLEKNYKNFRIGTYDFLSLTLKMLSSNAKSMIIVLFGLFLLLRIRFKISILLCMLLSYAFILRCINLCFLIFTNVYTEETFIFRLSDCIKVSSSLKI